MVRWLEVSKKNYYDYDNCKMSHGAEFYCLPWQMDASLSLNLKAVHEFKHILTDMSAGLEMNLAFSPLHAT